MKLCYLCDTECVDVLWEQNRTPIFGNSHQDNPEGDLTVRKSSPAHWFTNSKANIYIVQVWNQRHRLLPHTVTPWASSLTSPILIIIAYKNLGTTKELKGFLGGLQQLSKFSPPSPTVIIKPGLRGIPFA